MVAFFASTDAVQTPETTDARARARASSPTGNPARSSAAGSDEPRRRGDVDAIAMTTAD